MKKSEFLKLVEEITVSELSDKTYLSAAEKSANQSRWMQNTKFSEVFFDKYLSKVVFAFEPAKREKREDDVLIKLLPLKNRFRITRQYEIEIFFDASGIDSQLQNTNMVTTFLLTYLVNDDMFGYSDSSVRGGDFLKDYKITRKAAMFLASFAKAFNPSTKINANSFKLIERTSEQNIIDRAHQIEAPVKPATVSAPVPQ